MLAKHVLNRAGSVAATLDANVSLIDAAFWMNSRAGGLIVVRDPDPAGAVVGVVSDRTVVDSLARHGEAACCMPLRHIMNTDLAGCRPDDALETVLDIMLHKERRNLPVIADGHELVGVINIRDVLLFLFEDARLEDASLREYFLRLGYS